MTPELQSYARKALEAELARLDGEREKVMALLALLGKGTQGQPAIAVPSTIKRSRQMPEAGRQAIREAVKRRWERVRAANATERTGQADAPATESAAAPAASKKRRMAKAGNRKK